MDFPFEFFAHFEILKVLEPRAVGNSNRNRSSKFKTCVLGRVSTGNLLSEISQVIVIVQRLAV